MSDDFSNLLKSVAATVVSLALALVALIIAAVVLFPRGSHQLDGVIILVVIAAVYVGSNHLLRRLLGLKPNKKR